MADPARFCAMCQKEGAQQCTSCRAIRYCSRECQKLDWPLHKLLCKTWNEKYDDRHRPSPDFVRGIYFGSDELTPRFVWHAAGFSTSGQLEYQSPDIGKSAVEVPLTRNPIDFLNRPLFKLSEGKSIHLMRHLEKDRVPIGPANKAFTKISMELVEHEKGNIITCAFREDTRKIYDLSMANLRHIVDHLKSEYDRTIRTQTEKADGEMVQGVRWNCVGEYTVFGKCFETVTIPMPRESEGEWACSAAAKIGIPIVVQKCPPGISWQNRFGAETPADYNHHHARLTTLDLFNTSIINDGTYREAQALLYNRGSITVVRQDKKPLRPNDVSTMSAYFHEVFNDLVQKNLHSKTYGNWGIDVYLASLSKEKFLESYNAEKDKFKDMLPDVDKPSPYEV